MKRLTAFLLTIIFVAGLLPQNVLANQQNYIRSLIIKDVSQVGYRNYRVNFEWTVPAPSGVIDSAAGDGSVTHTIPADGRYQVLQRNMTTPDADYYEVDDLDGTEISYTYDASGGQLIDGSLYSFRIRPYHYHTYTNSQGVTYNAKAPYDESYPEEQVLYMTDIIVDGEGSGNELTVTWDNPTYLGQSIFSSYRIYYERGGVNVPYGFNTTYRDVMTSNATAVTDPTRPGISRLQYVIEDPVNVIPGETYAVRVEPLYNGVEIRENLRGLSYYNVSINGNSTKLTFRDILMVEYRNDTIAVGLPLEIQEYNDRLRLVWPSLANHSHKVSKITVMSNTSTNSVGWGSMGTLEGENASLLTFWPFMPPSQLTYYKIVVDFENGVTLESNVVYFNPIGVNLYPNKPEITFLVPPPGDPALNIGWTAFVRKAYNAAEEAIADANNYIVDFDIYYDMWITDDITNFSNVVNGLDKGEMPKVLDNIPASGLTYDSVNKMFSSIESDYYHFNEDTWQYEKKALSPNKTYYIKLIAKKVAPTPMNGSNILESEPAYATIYFELGDGGIGTPQVISKPPLRIKEDGNGNKEITQTEMTIEWRTKWYEIYVAGEGKWYPLAVNESNGNIVYDEFALQNYSLVEPPEQSTGESDSDYYLRCIAYAKSFLSSHNLSNSVRIMDISDADFEIYVVPYEDINAIPGGYNKYLEDLLNAGVAFQQINPTENPFGYEYTITGLDPNKQYAVLFRAIKTTVDGLKESYPTYLLATTLPVDDGQDVTPTVPNLYATGYTDLTVSVKWNYTVNFRYELSFSDKLLDYPDAGVLVGPDTLDVARVESEGSVRYKHYTIDGLYPATGYYVWVRAIVEDNGGTKTSAWSNPVLITTLDLATPNPPDGFGLASQSNVNLVNSEKSTEYVRYGEDYFILEWMKDPQDKTTTTAEGSGTQFEILTSQDITNMCLVLFSELTPNKQYYARAKTRVTVKKTDGIYGEKTFNYIIQISTSSNFTDYIEAVVPLFGGDADSSAVLWKESVFTETIIVRTGPSDDEYDGEIDPDLIPLPEDDFELIYDAKTQTLTYIFRSSGTDADGNDNNRVDQRLISRLISKGTYTYGIDLTDYNGQTIVNRVVIMPYSIFEAFEDRKISLKIKAHNMTVVYPPGALKTSAVKNMPQLGDGSLVTFSITEDISGLPTIEASSQTYISKPQKMSVYVASSSHSVAIDYFAEPVNIDLKLSNRYDVYNKHVGAYSVTSNVPGWNQEQSNYRQEDGMVSLKAAKTGAYSSISTNTATAVTDSSANDNMRSVSSRILIQNMGTYNANATVTAQQFNSFVYAIAMDQKSVDLDSALSRNEQTSMERAGLYIDSGQAVTREQAISILVRLYELKNNTKIEPYETLQTTAYSDIRNASAAYQNSLLKAEEISFLGNKTSASPASLLQMGDFMYMLDIILLDCGY